MRAIVATGLAWMGIFACGATKGPDGPHAAPPPPTASSTPISSAPIVFRRTADAPAFSDAKGTMKFSLVGHGEGVSVAPGEAALLFVHGGDGAKLQVPGKPDRHLVPYLVVDSARFSADAAHVALQTEELGLHVFAVQTGALEAKLEGGAFPVRFDGGSITHVGPRCALVKTDLASGTSTSLGPPRCPTPLRWGAVWRASDDGSVYALMEIGKFGYGALRSYPVVHLLDGKTGAELRVVRADDEDDPFIDADLSPRGDRFCFLRRPSGLECVRTADGRREKIVDDHVLRAWTFDLEGNQLLVPVGENDFGDKTLHLANLADATAHVVGASSQRYFRFLPGGRRFIGSGEEGLGATLYDLAADTARVLLPKGAESDGVNPIPERDDAFYLLKAVGAAEDLYRVQLP